MRDITLCHPRLQRIASAWIKACATEGISVAIGETLRTVAEQDALYAQGRTKPGNKVTNARGSSYSSQHQWGIAFDFYLKMDIDGDGSTSDDAFNDSTGMFKKASELAKGLEEIGRVWKTNRIFICRTGAAVPTVSNSAMAHLRRLKRPGRRRTARYQNSQKR